MTEAREGTVEGWNDEDSRVFQTYGDLFVPERELQIATVCDLIPPSDSGCDIVELCCGEGLLTRALLDRFPRARVVAFDGSEIMRDSTRRRAGDQATRLETRGFDLAASSWRRFDRPLHAVVSSLAVHHLDGNGKRQLYADMTQALAPGGALVIADLIAPAEALAKDYAARTWDQEVVRRAAERAAGAEAFTRFRELRWNLFADPDPDPMDQPSNLLDQLVWMREAGLVAVDTYWMKAGHAIFGGKKPRA